MVPADLLEPPLIVGIGPATVTQMRRDRVPQVLRRRLEIRALPGVRLPPPRHRVLPQPLEPLPNVPGPAFFWRDHGADRPQDMGQTLWLFHVVTGVGVVAPSAVCHHPPVVVRGHHLLDLRVALLGASLRSGGITSWTSVWRCWGRL